MSAREKTQADFDLERFIEMFDEALTSKDERVVNALRSLMMMVILTRAEATDTDREVGPFRQLYEDLHVLNRRMHDMEQRVRQTENMRREDSYKYWPPQSYTQDWESAARRVTMEEDARFNLMKATIAKINTPGKL